MLLQIVCSPCPRERERSDILVFNKLVCVCVGLNIFQNGYAVAWIAVADSLCRFIQNWTPGRGFHHIVLLSAQEESGLWIYKQLSIHTFVFGRKCIHFVSTIRPPCYTFQHLIMLSFLFYIIIYLIRLFLNNLTTTIKGLCRHNIIN